jgi:peptide/nickel transport system substrate-binding protein
MKTKPFFLRIWTNNMKALHTKIRMFGLIVLVMFLAGCNLQATELPSSTETENRQPTPTLTSTATPIPPKALNICIAEEPASLYRYSGQLNRATESIFASLYDGPFSWDAEQGTYAPSILSQYPTLENGLIKVSAVTVEPGDLVVDATGEVVVFKPGVLMRPAGCQDGACAVTWERGPFSMDQMSVTYALLPDLHWSDGDALQAKDLELSYTLAQQANLPSDAWALERTVSFQAQDDQTVMWQGLPGFITGNVQAFFWMPLPAHLLAGLEADQVAAAPAATQTPPGWGAYRLVNWEPGNVLHLEKNPYYFAAGNGSPAFDLLDFLIVPDVHKAMQMLSSRECDVLDSSYRLENLDKSVFETLVQTADLHMEFLESFEQLVFGVNPAAYDDGYSVWAGDRPDYFSDLRMRQAVAACLQPAALANAVLSEKFPVELLPQWEDWTTNWDAEALLEQAGWIDADGDPTTPRVAQGINGVFDLTPLSLSLVTSQAELDQQTGKLIVERLADCGIEVHWQALPTVELYAPGPEGVLFGRQFDLALLSWQTAGQNPCHLYLSNAIPSADKAWIGTNLAGWADPAYDLACGEKQMRLEPPESQDAWELLKANLPSIPLMPHPIVWASSSDMVVPEGANWRQIEKFDTPNP